MQHFFTMVTEYGEHILCTYPPNADISPPLKTSLKVDLFVSTKVMKRHWD